MSGVDICFFFLPLKFFHSFGAVGWRGDVAVFKAGLTNVSLVELGGPLAILSKKTWRKRSHDGSSLCKNTKKTIQYYEASLLRIHVHLSFKKVHHYFTISSEFSDFFSQRLVTFDAKQVCCLVLSQLKPHCSNLHAYGTFSITPFTIHIWNSIRFGIFLPNYTKTCLYLQLQSRSPAFSNRVASS